MKQDDQEPDVKLHELLKKLIELNGSDLHLTTGTPPQVRIDGELQPLDGYCPLGRDDTERLIYSVLSDAQKKKFQQDLELDLSFGIVNVSRFRLNVFDGRGGVGAVFRAIPFEVKCFDEVGLPPVVSHLFKNRRRLVLVTGLNASGTYTHPAPMIG